MPAKRPSSKPQWTRERVMQEIEKRGISIPETKVFLVGVRAYYLDTMGEKGKNDRGMYDDAMFIISPGSFTSWNANTDPSIQRKGIATLRPGVHLYKEGNHGISRPGGGYPAFRPATKDEELPVDRDGVPDPRPGVAINIHKGGDNSTSSEGCQTTVPEQWADFQKTLHTELARNKQKTFPYVLISLP